jgi:hypothetical protein
MLHYERMKIRLVEHYVVINVVGGYSLSECCWYNGDDEDDWDYEAYCGGYR